MAEGPGSLIPNTSRTLGKFEISFRRRRKRNQEKLVIQNTPKTKQQEVLAAGKKTTELHGLSTTVKTR
jgi:hypothetical protein